MDDAMELKSRRALLAGAAGGVAALMASAFGRVTPAAASHGDVHLGEDNVTSMTTRIRSTSADFPAFIGYTLHSGDGVWGVSKSGDGVYGESDPKNGVHGRTVDGNGVYGESAGGGTAVAGMARSGMAIHGWSQGAGWTSVVGLKENAGTAVQGLVVDGSSSSPAVEGYTAGTGAGVSGEAALGRGGRFKGRRAQIKLEPSTASNHPRSGQAGDIFLDASKRLWLCKGGTSWVRIV